MPGHNHTKRNVVETTRDCVTLDQEGNFYCHHCGGFGQGYIGRTTLAVQRHFESTHDVSFGKTVFEWLPDPKRSSAPTAGHMLSEGIA